MQRIDYGGSLVASLTLVYSNAADKFKVEGEVSVNVLQGTVEVKGDLNLVDDDVRKRTKVVFRFEQVGGEPTAALNVVDKSMLTCSFEKEAFTNCVQAFSRIMDYAKDSFGAQLTDRSKLVPLRIFTASLANAGDLKALVPESPSELDLANSRLAREELEREYRRHLQILARGQAVSEAARLSTRLRERFTQTIAAAQSNLSQITQGYEACLENPLGKNQAGENLCAAARDNITKNLKPVDLSDLAFNTLPQSCRDVLLYEPDLAKKDGVYEIYPGGRVLNVYCDMTFAGGGWTLVRRQQPGRGFAGLVEGFTGTDAKRGQDSSFQVPGPRIGDSFNYQFADVPHNDFLFASGDAARWLIVDKIYLQEDRKDSGNCDYKAFLKASHLSSTPYTVNWCKRPGVTTDPHITARDHFWSDASGQIVHAQADTDEHSVLYRLDKEIPIDWWDYYVNNRDGLNMWIR